MVREGKLGISEECGSVGLVICHGDGDDQS